MLKALVNLFHKKTPQEVVEVVETKVEETPALAKKPQQNKSANSRSQKSVPSKKRK